MSKYSIKIGMLIFVLSWGCQRSVNQTNDATAADAGTQTEALRAQLVSLPKLINPKTLRLPLQRKIPPMPIQQKSITHLEDRPMQVATKLILQEARSTPIEMIPIESKASIVLSTLPSLKHQSPHG